MQNFDNHIKTIFSNYYQNKETYNGSNSYHGISHVARAATYALAVSQIFKAINPKFGNSAKSFENFQTLVFIGTLLHDSGRPKGEDGIDLWDRDSAINTYHYLIQTGFGKDLAKATAEAVANKDFFNTKHTTQTNVYYRLVTKQGGDQIEFIEDKKAKASSLTTDLIHCIQFGDCMDIMRARDYFDAKYTSLYQLFIDPSATNKINQTLKTHLQIILDDVIGDALKLVNLHGFLRSNHDSKKQIQHASSDILTQINQELNETKILHQLLNNSGFSITEYINNREILHKNQSEIQQSLEDGLIVLRGISGNTNTEIDNVLKPDGNMNRSVAVLVHPRVPAFSDYGFMISFNNQNELGKRVTNFHNRDTDTGFANKDHHTQNTKQVDLTHQNHKRNKAKSLFGLSVGLPHTEAVMTINQQDIKAVYYCLDPNIQHHHSPNKIFSMEGKEHKHIYKMGPIPSTFLAKLQAIHLKQAFSSKTEKNLNIFEYSWINATMKPMQFSNDAIIELWRGHINDPTDSFSFRSIHKIEQLLKKYGTNYDENLKDSISQLIKDKTNVMAQNLMKRTNLIELLTATVELTNTSTKEQSNQAIQSLLTHINSNGQLKAHFIDTLNQGIETISEDKSWLLPMYFNLANELLNDKLTITPKHYPFNYLRNLSISEFIFREKYGLFEDNINKKALLNALSVNAFLNKNLNDTNDKKSLYTTYLL
ncbi:hypothetical protein L3V82_10075 [Thiotrichales bacterium 19S3-7]|nr:hypothetical protein [Thiotrichales bacterium 19S3-7]MCF6802502.1 hypothetical protein [Thiotrichales bacterium 19S3-11]